MWLLEGDINTKKKNHNNTINKRNINGIVKIKDYAGRITENSKEIAENFVKYYIDILNKFESLNLAALNKMIESIPKVMITAEDNEYLNKKFTKEEIKDAIFQINLDKSSASLFLSKILGYSRRLSLGSY